jgi:hypothetical protein
MLPTVNGPVAMIWYGTMEDLNNRMGDVFY